MKYKLELPNLNDASELSQLINDAYRGETGWTRETGIVSGERTNINDTKALIANPKSHLLVAKDNESIIACICIEQKESQTYIGSLAVNSNYQNKGLGKEMLRLAEEYALNELNSNEYIMVVISQRKELIAFYERRGYKKTGELEQYPVHLNVGEPLTNDLTIEYLKKKHNKAIKSFATLSETFKRTK